MWGTKSCREAQSNALMFAASQMSHLEKEKEPPGQVLPLLQNVASGQIDRQARHEAPIRQILQGTEELCAKAALTPAHHIPAILQACLQDQPTTLHELLIGRTEKS